MEGEKPKEKAAQTEQQQTKQPEETSPSSFSEPSPTMDSNVSEVERMVQKMNIKQQKEQKKEQESHENAQQQQENAHSEDSEGTSKQVTETKYFVEVNRSQILFGKNTLFPGSIEEIDVSIGLNEDSMEESSNPLLLRVIARCANNEFDDLDEYVFSVRSNERFEYFEEVRFKIRKKQRAHVKVAVKIPPVSQNYTINGFIDIQLENLTPYCVPITAKCEVPQIISLKDLYKSDQGTQMIKIPGKKSMPRMPPIPFKNISNFNFSLEVEAISNENFSNRAFDVVTQNFVNCQANTQFFVNMQLKQNLNYHGVKPTRDTIRKILVLKIKNSSVFYHYPIEVNVYDGKPVAG